MTQAADPITLSVPRAVLSEIVRLTDELTDRMHALLERNTDGQLSATERAELDTLVRLAQFGQIAATALRDQKAP